MRIRRGRYLLSRVVKINLTQNDLMDAICNPSIIKVRNHNWTLTDIVDARHDEKLPFIFGRLVKYADDELDVVDEHKHKQSQSKTENLVKASSPFVYLPEFSGICFLHVYNGIQSDVFPRRFKSIIEDSRNLKFNDLLIECDVDAITDYAAFRKKITSIKKVVEINVTVSPPNPLFGWLWKSLKQFLEERRTTTLKINEESEKKEGLKTQIPEIMKRLEANDFFQTNMEIPLPDAALLMAADGYGKGKIIGENSEKEIIEVKTEDAQKSFLFEKNSEPIKLARRAQEEFLKINDERKMEH